ncbi:MAG: plasmid pRiA4b ORF-3 family protein [Prevotellaceae bacterium]|jgi:hypothetical protein|nr:plasmid pRiA4b ORF-3 family protein [Prevotellaceae bacterium]
MISRFKLSFPEKPEFKREYDIDAGQTLYDFHRLIQSDLDYDESQPVLFFTASSCWEPEREFSLLGANDAELMDEVTVGTLIRESNHRLLYMFDVINRRCFKVELQEMLEPTPRARYPRTASECGDPPPQTGKSNSAFSSIFDQAMPDFDASTIYTTPAGGE